MPTCRNCGAEHAAGELVRHERDSLLFVHCPDCNTLMGQYNERSH